MIDDSDAGSWARFMRHQGITPVFHPVSDQLNPSGNDQRTDAKPDLTETPNHD